MLAGGATAAVVVAVAGSKGLVLRSRMRLTSGACCSCCAAGAGGHSPRVGGVGSRGGAARPLSTQPARRCPWSDTAAAVAAVAAGLALPPTPAHQGPCCDSWLCGSPAPRGPGRPPRASTWLLHRASSPNIGCVLLSPAAAGAEEQRCSWREGVPGSALRSSSRPLQVSVNPVSADVTSRVTCWLGCPPPASCAAAARAAGAECCG